MSHVPGNFASADIDTSKGAIYGLVDPKLGVVNVSDDRVLGECTLYRVFYLNRKPKQMSARHLQTYVPQPKHF